MWRRRSSLLFAAFVSSWLVCGHAQTAVAPEREIGNVAVGWNLQPAAPKLRGKILFMTDGSAISYAESVMGYVHDRHLATIVGSTTAGTNGNIAHAKMKCSSER